MSVETLTYVFVGLYFEERTLVAELGEDYVRYQQSTPAVIPGLRPVRQVSTESVKTSTAALPNRP